jgi:hypothetical protein
MAEFQSIPKSELMTRLQALNVCARILIKEFAGVKQDEIEARSIANGVSQIWSYYDKGRYICTLHMIKQSDGVIVHKDVKDATINGERYKGV